MRDAGCRRGETQGRTDASRPPLTTADATRRSPHGRVDPLLSLRDPARPYKTYGTSRRGAAAHCGTSAPRPKAAPSRRPRSLRGTRRVRSPFHLKAALIVNPLGATVVTWVTNWPRHCIPFPSRIPRPCRPLGPRVLRLPFPQIPTRHGQLPDEETRTVGGVKKEKKTFPGRALVQD